MLTHILGKVYNRHTIEVFFSEGGNRYRRLKALLLPEGSLWQSLRGLPVRWKRGLALL